MPRKKKNEASGSLVNVNVPVTATAKASDLLGLGKASYSPAAQEIANAVAQPLKETFRNAASAFLERHAAQARADASVISAQAKGKVALIEAQSRGDLALLEDELRAKLQHRAGERLKERETLGQYYIEQTTEEAMKIAEERDSPETRQLDDGFVLSWIDDIKGVHSDVVRHLYARILENQTRIDSDMISGPSMMLMRSIDGRLAEQFAKYVAFVTTYKCYPLHENIVASGPLAIPRKDILLLEEIGFLRALNGAFFPIPNAKIRLYGGKFTYNHASYILTGRALELAQILYGKQPFREGLRDYIQDSDEQARFLQDFVIQSAINWVDGAEVVLNDGTKDVQSWIFVMLRDAQAQKIGGFVDKPKQDIGYIMDKIKSLGVVISNELWTALAQSHEASHTSFLIEVE